MKQTSRSLASVQHVLEIEAVRVDEELVRRDMDVLRGAIQLDGRAKDDDFVAQDLDIEDAGMYKTRVVANWKWVASDSTSAQDVVRSLLLAAATLRVAAPLALRILSLNLCGRIRVTTQETTHETTRTATISLVNEALAHADPRLNAYMLQFNADAVKLSSNMFRSISKTHEAHFFNAITSIPPRFSRRVLRPEERMRGAGWDGDVLAVHAAVTAPGWRARRRRSNVNPRPQFESMWYAFITRLRMFRSQCPADEIDLSRFTCCFASKSIGKLFMTSASVLSEQDKAIRFFTLLAPAFAPRRATVVSVHKDAGGFGLQLHPFNQTFLCFLLIHAHN